MRYLAEEVEIIDANSSTQVLRHRSGDAADDGSRRAHACGREKIGQLVSHDSPHVAQLIEAPSFLIPCDTLALPPALRLLSLLRSPA